MSEEALFPYYQRELTFFRQMSQEFAKQYPAVANRLLLDPNRSLDPHVERLIESFALLAGRIRHKLDDEFPELTDALLSVLYPHYLAPIPSMAVVQFDFDPSRAQLPEGFLIDKGSPLHTAPVDGLACRFRTGYPTRLWPLEVAAARVLTPPFPSEYRPPQGTVAALRLQLGCRGELPLTELQIDRLRFHLTGDGEMVAALYESLFAHALEVLFRAPDGETRAAPRLKPGECLFPVGFEPDEGLIPYPKQAFPGYRLLTEFFAFPAKFLFFELGGFDKVRKNGFQRNLEVIVFLDRNHPGLEQAVEASTFRVGCAPIVNLFEQTAEAVPLTHLRSEYRLVPDVAYPHGLEVFSVDSVTSADLMTQTSHEYQPFYSFRHGGNRETARTFWYPSRQEAKGKDPRGKPMAGTDVYLNLVDLDFDPRSAADPSLIVRTTCTNRDLPLQLRMAGEDIYFELEPAAPLSGVRCVRTPTAPLRPSRRRGSYWRLVSHLSLNHLSLTEPEEGRAALQEILRLYDFSNGEAGQQLAAINEQLIDGITAVSSRPKVGRTGSPTSGGFCRGTEVTIEFDEQKYVGTGLLLFACVLERFLGLYVSINSFSELVATTKQRQGILKRWPPRAGELPLL
jgi:type VI secretion system protein ImpG